MPVSPPYPLSGGLSSREGDFLGYLVLWSTRSPGIDIMVEGAVRILEVVVCEANVGVIRGAEERGNECVAVILIHRLLAVALLRSQTSQGV